MINQEQFLKALQERISVLEQAEQQDILAEYAQHIEMLMKDGLTEEEAIRDFGPVDELAAEILEAYHIDPVRVKAAETAIKPKKTETVQTAAKAAGSGLVRGWKSFTAADGWKKFCNAVAQFCCCIGRGCKRFGSWVRGLFHRQPGRETVVAQGERPPRMPKAKRELRRIWRGVKKAMKMLARLCWNGCLMILALPVFLLAFADVLCLGLLLVLLLQGYPVTGMTMVLLGGLLLCGALLGLCWTWIWRWRTASAPVEGENMMETAAKQKILWTAAETMEERGESNDE